MFCELRGQMFTPVKRSYPNASFSEALLSSPNNIEYLFSERISNKTMGSNKQPRQRPRGSAQPSVSDPKTPVKNVRFAKLPGENTPRSVLATPASCTSACSNLSSLADTPLSEKMAKVADRCISLLDEYFTGKPLEPLSLDVDVEGGDDFDIRSIDFTPTLFSDEHSAETFHRYPELPTEVQEMILEQALTSHQSPDLAKCTNEFTRAAPAVATVSKKTYRQVIRVVKTLREKDVEIVDKSVARQGEQGA